MEISATSEATGTRTHKVFAFLLLGLLVWTGCAGEAHRNPAAVYAQAESAFKAGNFSEALKKAEAGAAAWRNSPETAWYWNFLLLHAEISLARGDIQAALPGLQSSPSSSVPDRDHLEVRLLKDRAQIARNNVEAIGLLDVALRRSRALSLEDLLPEIEVRRAPLLVESGKFELSESELREAAAITERRHDPYWQSAVLGTLGYLMLRSYRYDEALLWFEQSRQVSEDSNNLRATAKTIDNMGWCYYRLGDFERAEKYFSESEPRFEKLGLWDDQQIAVGNLGSARYSRQDYQGALSNYRRALTLAESHHLQAAKALWLTNIASTYLAIGDFRSADSYNRQALELQSRLNSSVVNVLPLLNAAQISLDKNNYDASEQYLVDALKSDPDDPDRQWEIHEGLAELYDRKGDPERAEREYRAAIGILDDSWSTLLNSQSKLTFPSRLTHFNHEYVDFLMAQGRKRDALEFVESRRARLLAEKLGTGSEGEDFSSVARRTGSVLLSYWLAPSQSYLWVTTANDSQAIPLGREDHIREMVERYSKSVTDENADESLARRLYELLVAPAQKLLLPGSRVVVVPDGCLHQLNFETLIAPTGKYWIEDAIVTVAPSLALLRQRRPTAGASRSILLIGDPALNATAQLPNAHNEINGIAELYGKNATVRIGENAKPEGYRAAKPFQFGAIHFAAHAVANRDSPFDSAVLLSQGAESSKLYAREVQEIPLSADLVTISACSSAGARTYAGEGLVGFASAFLSAGARNVVASLWDVSDRSTALFMQPLYQRVAKGMDPAKALREVKLQFLHSHDARHKPYYWAPFQVYVR
ncbi:MAG TPA: CHAT domain-containing protein [Bryobacteraceae bacterium]|nr:CHAT domain-containing protein [Bryobacteraceae bacterium]